MPQFDVYPNPSATSRMMYPLVVDVQHQHLSRLKTRLVLPLQSASDMSIDLPRTLRVPLWVAGKQYRMAPQVCGAVPHASLKKSVGNVRAQRDLIRDAMDAVFQGF